MRSQGRIRLLTCDHPQHSLTFNKHKSFSADPSAAVIGTAEGSGLLEDGSSLRDR